MRVPGICEVFHAYYLFLALYQNQRNGLNSGQRRPQRKTRPTKELCPKPVLSRQSYPEKKYCVSEKSQGKQSCEPRCKRLSPLHLSPWRVVSLCRSACTASGIWVCLVASCALPHPNLPGSTLPVFGISNLQIISRVAVSHVLPGKHSSRLALLILVWMSGQLRCNFPWEAPVPFRLSWVLCFHTAPCQRSYCIYYNHSMMLVFPPGLNSARAGAHLVYSPQHP